MYSQNKWAAVSSTIPQQNLKKRSQEDQRNSKTCRFFFCAKK